MAQKVKIALLPCPCCGGDAEYTETCLPDAYSDHEIIACTECHLQMDNASPKEWNRRVQAAQQLLAPDACPVCKHPSAPNGIPGCGNDACPSRAGKA